MFESVANPESVTVKAVSEPDTVFGREYVTDEEQMAIAVAMVNINKKVMADTQDLSNLDLSNQETTELMERQMSAMSALRSLATPHKPGESKPPFNGWKVKVEYEAKTIDGKQYHSEYWFRLDKNAEYVIKSFEIPLL